MKFDSYQDLSSRTINRELSERDQLASAAMGLAGEAGEAADIVKKHLYHGHDLDRGKLLAELGDVLWYVAAVCTAAGIEFDDVAAHNVAKLCARYPDGFSDEASRNRVRGPHTIEVAWYLERGTFVKKVVVICFTNCVHRFEHFAEDGTVAPKGHVGICKECGRVHDELDNEEQGDSNAGNNGAMPRDSISVPDSPND